MPAAWSLKQCRTGSSATLLSSFGGLLGFTKRDYCSPTGAVLPFIQAVCPTACCISVLNVTAFGFINYLHNKPIKLRWPSSDLLHETEVNFLTC